MKCVLFVCACRLECNQQLSAAYCSQSASCGHFGNEEYIESYGKTYDGYIYIYIYTDALAVLLVHVGLAQACLK